MTIALFCRRLAAAAGLLFAAAAAAAPVGFDNTFGAGGKAYLNLSFGTSNDIGQAVAIQPDGAVVVAGTCSTGFTQDFCIARFLANGDLDPSFGNGGKVATAVGVGDDFARAIALDGTRIVVAGSCTQGGETDFCVARYLADGTLDPSFNVTGTAITPVGLLADQAYAVAMDGTGILVAGECEVEGLVDSCLLRYLADGTVDSNYGSAGRVIVPMSPSFNGIRGLAVTGGKAVVAAYCIEFGISSFCIARLNADGSLDGAFGSGGIVATLLTPNGGFQRIDIPNALSVMTDGRIVAAGQCRVDNLANNGMCALVLNADGTPSSAVNGDGRVILTVATTTTAAATAVATTGSSAIYLAGPCTASGVQRFCVAALNGLGGLSGSFNGGQPLVDTLNLSVDAVPNAVAALFDPFTLNTDIVVAGACGTTFARDFCVARYLQTGARRTAFGSLGVKVQELTLGRFTDYAEGLARQPDGRTVVVGTCEGSRACIARFNPDGSLDTGFATGGIFLDAPNTSSGFGAKVAVEATGILHATANSAGLRVTRLLASGAPDPAWGGGTGTVTHAFPGLVVARMSGVELVGGGSVIGFACEVPGNFNSFCLAKLDAAGALDPTFNAAGTQPGFRKESFTTDDRAYAMAMDGSSIVMAGHCGVGMNIHPCIMKFTSAGLPDTTFNGTGKLGVPMGTTTARFFALSVSAGVITAGGACTPGDKEDFCLARVAANGTLDVTFNGTGKASLSMGPFKSQVQGLVADGSNVVAIGTCAKDSIGAANDVCLARFTAGGIPDVDFNGGGSLRSQVGTATINRGVTGLIRDGARFLASVQCQPANGDGVSDFCLAAWLELPASLPGAPTITGALAGDTQATVSFVPPVDNGGSAITGFTATCGAQSASGSGSPLTVTGLLNGVSVPCAVTATNSAGTGPASDPPVNVTPLRATTLTLTANVNPSSSTGTVRFTVIVAGQSPTGSVTLKLPGGAILPNCNSVGVSAGAISCDVTAFFAPGTYSITAHYSGDAANAPAISAPLSHTVIATFEALTISKQGSGVATVTSAPAGIACGTTCTGQFPTDTNVILTAAPSTGTSVSWTGCTIPANGNECLVRMSAGVAVQLTLTFQQFALTVAKAGAGAGTVSSSPAGIDCGATCTANLGAGTVATLAATPSSGSLFTGWSGACTGTAACQVTVDAAKSVTATFGLAPPPPPPPPPADPPRLGNLSTRMQVLTGNDVMIGGFVVGGSTSKTVVVRARGPSLVPFGISNALADPHLQLVRSSDQATLAINDNWGSAANAAAVTASGFAPGNALEAAILVALPPGAYTAIVTGVGSGTGVGIVEVFEVDQPQAPLANISTRGQVLGGNDVMIGGFVINGDAPQTVVLRARGPSLVPFGITNALANPSLQLVRSADQVGIASNDDWGSAGNAAALAASGFAPSNPLESALLVTLPPGAYTAIVTGAGGTTGVGIVEVFAQ